MDQIITWVVLAVLIGFGIAAILRNSKFKQDPDYYNLFVIGIIWLAFGIPLSIKPLWALGIALAITGLMNKKKWKREKVSFKDLGKEEKKVHFTAIMVGLFLLLAAAIFYLISN